MVLQNKCPIKVINAFKRVNKSIRIKSVNQFDLHIKLVKKALKYNKCATDIDHFHGW